jgi:hypothetical protein
LQMGGAANPGPPWCRSQATGAAKHVARADLR